MKLLKHINFKNSLTLSVVLASSIASTSLLGHTQEASPSPTPAPQEQATPQKQKELSKEELQKLQKQLSQQILANKKRAWLIDEGNGRILSFLPQEPQRCIALGGSGRGVGSFLKPSQIWLNPKGYVFIADTNNDRIVSIASPEGYGWESMEELKRPSGIALHGNKLFVSERDANQIRLFQSFKGKEIKTLSHPKLLSPGNLWIDAKGDLFICYQTTLTRGGIARCQDPLGDQPTWEFYDHHQYLRPHFMPRQVVTIGKHLYFLDRINNKIGHLESFPHGKLELYGKLGSSQSSFNHPQGLSVLPDGNLLVSDSSNDRVMKIQFPITPESSSSIELDKELKIPLSYPTSLFLWQPIWDIDEKLQEELQPKEK